MNTKVVITGSLGYIGSELLKQASKHDITCLPIDKEYQSRSEGTRLNLRDYKKTAKAIKNFGPDIFLHAGTHSALAYRDNFLSSFTEDFEVMASVLKSLSQMPDCKMIYFSSSYVYSGLATNQKVYENNPLKPNHNFGIAKAFFEQFILKNRPNSIIFRLSSVFGPGKAKNPNTVLNFAKECLQKKRITVWGAGTRKIQYIYMKDVINCVLQSFNLKPGIYNLGGDDYVSVADVARTIAAFYKAKVTFLKDKLEGEALPFLDNDKLKTALKKKLFTPFSTALMEYLNTLK